MAENDEIFLGPGAKGDPYHPGPLQTGEATAPEPVTDVPVEVPGQLFGADAHAADVAADTTPSSSSTDEHADDAHDDDHEVT